MKILIISHLYPRKNNSILGNFVHSQALWLKSAGHDVEVVSPQGYFWPIKKNNGAAHAVAEGINVSYVSYLTFSNLGLLWTDYLLAKIIRKSIDVADYDLIYAHTLLPDGSTAIKLGKKFNKPVSVYIHGADVQKKNDRWYLKRKIQKGLTSADQVLVNSRKTEKLVNDIIGAKKALLSPLGVWPVPVYPKKTSPELRLLTVGNLVPEKGHRYSIEAVKRLIKHGMNLEFKIVGDGPEAAHLKKMATGYDQICFLGRVNNEIVQKEMANTDIFLMPSFNEAFGVVYLEALWQRTPIIGCRGQGVEDILQYGECGILVEPQNTQSIERAILQLGSLAKRKIMGEEGHRIVKENFLWNDNMAKIEKYLINMRKK
jgi:glycosyltransferase involved in cell wall biosynthesis